MPAVRQIVDPRVVKDLVLHLLVLVGVNLSHKAVLVLIQLVHSRRINTCALVSATSHPKTLAASGYRPHIGHMGGMRT